MTLFLGTLVIIGLSCLAMSLGVLLGGRPLAGGCGKAPGAAQCEGCSKRRRHGAQETNAEGES